MNSPLDLFFKMGEKVTKGDPNRQADFVYYMVWILFTAFATMFFSNAYRLITTGEIDYAIWTLVGFAITGIQYFSLKGMYDMKQLRKQTTVKAMPLDSVEDMMKEFDNEENASSIKSK